MNESFVMLVTNVLCGFFQQHNFHQIYSHTNENGLFSEVVFASNECKLRFFNSIKNGETNCLIGLPSANNCSDWTTKPTREWFFLHQLLEIGKGLTFEELVEIAEQSPFGAKAQLKNLRDLLDSGFDKALKQLYDVSAAQ